MHAWKVPCLSTVEAIALLTDRDGMTHKRAIKWFDVTIQGAWVGGQTTIVHRLFVPDARSKSGFITLLIAGEAKGMPVGSKEFLDARSGRQGRARPPDRINPVESLTRSSCPLETGPVGWLSRCQSLPTPAGVGLQRSGADPCHPDREGNPHRTSGIKLIASHAPVVDKRQYTSGIGPVGRCAGSGDSPLRG